MLNKTNLEAAIASIGEHLARAERCTEAQDATFWLSQAAASWHFAVRCEAETGMDGADTGHAAGWIQKAMRKCGHAALADRFESEVEEAQTDEDSFDIGRWLADTLYSIYRGRRRR